MKLLDAEIDITTNRWLLFDRYRLLFLVLVYSAMVDAFTTTYFMAHIGPEHESNAAVRMLSYTFGIVWGPLIGKSLQVFAVWLITVFTPNLTRLICAVIISLNLYAGYVNLHV
jgi:hypothetical protein